MKSFIENICSKVRASNVSHPSPLISHPSSLLPAFTLIELLVVICMITVIMGAFVTSVGAARHRARMQKALGDVKVISQAILAYENYAEDHELPTMEREPAGKSSLGFLLGQGEGTGAEGGKKSEIPVLIQAALTSGGEIRDPWGHPYLVTIRSGSTTIKLKTATSSMNTGFYLPNFYKSER